MQLSTPTALGGGGGEGVGLTGQKTPKQGLPHHTTPPLSLLHTILQLHRPPSELFVSMSLLLLLITC